MLEENLQLKEMVERVAEDNEALRFALGLRSPGSSSPTPTHQSSTLTGTQERDNLLAACDQLRCERNAACDEVERLTVSLAASETRVVELELHVSARAREQEGHRGKHPQQSQRELTQLRQQNALQESELAELRAELAGVRAELAEQREHQATECADASMARWAAQEELSAANAQVLALSKQVEEQFASLREYSAIIQRLRLEYGASNSATTTTAASGTTLEHSVGPAGALSAPTAPAAPAASGVEPSPGPSEPSSEGTLDLAAVQQSNLKLAQVQLSAQRQIEARLREELESSNLRRSSREVQAILMELRRSEAQISQLEIALEIRRSRSNSPVRSTSPTRPSTAKPTHSPVKAISPVQAIAHARQRQAALAARNSPSSSPPRKNSRVAEGKSARRNK